MPLPLPIMIPFMMWQSAAIAAGFGTYFQFAKRRVSAMSNDEFNAADPHELVNSMYNDIVQQIPSYFAKVDSLTPVMLQSMNTMLDQAVKWLQGAITGNIFGTPNPVNTEIPELDTGTGTDAITLLNPSASEISSWPTTLLNVRHNTQLHLYTTEAQAIIKGIFNVRQRDPTIRNEPRVEIPTVDIPEGFLSTINTNNYPDLAALHLKRIREASNYADAIKRASVQWSFTRFKSINERSQTARDVFLKQKIAWGRLIVALNKAVSANLPFRL